MNALALPGSVQLRDRAVYLADADALVVADLHLGRGDRSRVAAPIDAVDAVGDRIGELVSAFSPRWLVCAGDLFDAFDTIPSGVTPRFERIQALAEAAGAECVILSGNHDGMVSEAYAGPIEEELRLADTIISHGHELPSRGANRYVIGHEHPAIRLGGRKRPCYLYREAAWRDGAVLVLPAFSHLVPGTTLNYRTTADCHAPLLRTSGLAGYQPVVRDETADETFVFPRLGTLREYL